MEQQTPESSVVEDKTVPTLSLNSTTTDPALKVMCDEYGKYLDFPELTKSQIKSIEDTIENMLARLDEFAAFVEVVRQDSAKSLKLFPVLKEKCQQIEKTFSAIDALESVLQVVNVHLDQLDERANSADKVIAALNAEHSQTKKWFAKMTNATTIPASDYKWTPMQFVTADQIITTIRDASKNAPASLHMTPVPSSPTITSTAPPATTPASPPVPTPTPVSTPAQDETNK